MDLHPIKLYAFQTVIDKSKAPTFAGEILVVSSSPYFKKSVQNKVDSNYSFSTTTSSKLEKNTTDNGKDQHSNLKKCDKSRTVCSKY